MFKDLAQRIAGGSAVMLRGRAASVLAACDAGVNIVDLAIASMSGSTSQPNLNSVVAALQHTPRDTGLDLDALSAHLQRCLPAYARPLFLRLRGEMDVTSTFKHAKSDLAREGYDPGATSDPLYFNDSEKHRYLLIDTALHARLRCGEIRL